MAYRAGSADVNCGLMVCDRLPCGLASHIGLFRFHADGFLPFVIALNVGDALLSNEPAASDRKIGIPYGSSPKTCPVRTLQSWIEAAALTAGPVFRSINRHGRVQSAGLSGIDVARVVKKLAGRAGLDPRRFAGHSLRAGHATSAAIAGASERSIMNHTGHRPVQMVRRYIRDGSLFRENFAGKLGL
jgi:integrase